MRQLRHGRVRFDDVADQPLAEPEDAAVPEHRDGTDASSSSETRAPLGPDQRFYRVLRLLGAGVLQLDDVDAHERREAQVLCGRNRYRWGAELDAIAAKSKA